MVMTFGFVSYLTGGETQDRLIFFCFCCFVLLFETRSYMLPRLTLNCQWFCLAFLLSAGTTLSPTPLSSDAFNFKLLCL